MRTFTLLAAAAFAAAAVPASATVVVYNGSNYNTGDTINISFTGVNNSGVHATLGLTFQSVDAAGDLHFLYTLTNTSNAANNGSNASAFGFNVDPSTFSLALSSITGDFVNKSSGSIANGYSVEFCGTAGPNCAGGASGGAMIGDPFTGGLILGFTGNAAPTTVTLTDPRVRFQNTSPVGSDTAIPSNDPPPAVPEPATWAMMLAGFGATGFTLRRSRRKAQLTQAA